jgi:ABC-2 type transport system ATP-binding protein
MSIEVKDLLKIYGEQKAVNHISFKAGKGQIVGFLGPNGAGKSTTMKIITGYLKATSGQAWVCGIPVDQSPLESKKKIGYLPEQNALYYDMYVREYLGFIAEVHKITEPKKRINEVLELTGLVNESAKKIGQLSKGYKQRVGLSAALVHDPEVLILDEPTSGLDPNQIVEIREVIKRQGKEKTVLFSTHILQEVEAICDRVIIINKGELVADDTLANLQNAGSKSQLVSVRFSEPVDKALLESIEGIIGVTSQGNNYMLRTNNPELVRKKILALAVENNLNIISLQSGDRRLEDIFRSLTGNTTANV